MTNLFLDRILEFYGVPQILVAKDSFGTQYLCLLFDDGAGCRYTGIKISSSRLDDYWGGRIDLRTLYLNPENDNEYFNVSYNDNHYELQSFEGKDLPEERLPEKGYFHVESRSEIYTIKVPSCDKIYFQDIRPKDGMGLYVIKTSLSFPKKHLYTSLITPYLIYSAYICELSTVRAIYQQNKHCFD